MFSHVSKAQEWWSQVSILLFMQISKKEMESSKQVPQTHYSPDTEVYLASYLKLDTKGL